MFPKFYLHARSMIVTNIYPHKSVTSAKFRKRCDCADSSLFKFTHVLGVTRLCTWTFFLHGMSHTSKWWGTWCITSV